MKWESPTVPVGSGGERQQEAPHGKLVSIGSGVLMRRKAAQSFEQMRRAAAAQGVRLRPISGFRTVATQRHLFHGIAAARGQSLRIRARVSAPPGHSEHHTGYTVDIGDASAPGANLRVAFQSTRAGQWLLANASQFGFELSFPRQHTCVSYEPWHWRWVNDDESRRTFRTARRHDDRVGIERTL